MFFCIDKVQGFDAQLLIPNRLLSDYLVLGL